jgi:mono/diheme cytochrome c family protein
LPDDVKKASSFQEAHDVKSASVLSAIAALGIATAIGLSPASAAGSVTPSAGAYSAKQAADGKTLYGDNCSSCHGVNLRGVIGPALVGDAFTSQWTNEPASDMYGLMSKNMPLGAPGSLKASEYLAITAYLLQQNKYPVGATPLTLAKLKTVKLSAAPRK